jgi:hypothetical protein
MIFGKIFFTIIVLLLPVMMLDMVFPHNKYLAAVGWILGVVFLVTALVGVWSI